MIMYKMEYIWRLSLVVLFQAGLFGSNWQVVADSAGMAGERSSCNAFSNNSSPTYSIQVFHCETDSSLEPLYNWNDPQPGCNRTIIVQGVADDEKSGRTIYTDDIMNISVQFTSNSSSENSPIQLNVAHDEEVTLQITDGEQLIYEDAELRISAAMMCEILPKDCREVQAAGHNESGRYEIYPAGDPLEVFCDMQTDGGGWTVIQRRENDLVDFYRSWTEYKQGFGSVAGNHWLGNDKIHCLTSRSQYRLRVDLVKFNGDVMYTEYDHFEIAGEDEDYRLNIGNLIGGAHNGLLENDGMPFTTHDRDNRNFFVVCAESHRGAWWYAYCGKSNLNGRYYDQPSQEVDRIFWSDSGDTFEQTKMMIR